MTGFNTNSIETGVQTSVLEQLYFDMLSDYSIDFKYNHGELDNIPKEGPFIVVSNHPLKGLDNIMLIKVISEVRPDILLLNNFALPKYSDVKRYFIRHNSQQLLKLFSPGVRLKALDSLKKGIPVGIFPSGDFEQNNSLKSSSDNFWNAETIRFIKDAKVPVVPAFFHVKSTLSASLYRTQQLILPESAEFNEDLKNRKVSLRIGAPIRTLEQDEFHNIDKYGRYLRAKVYSLETKMPVKKFFTAGLRRSAKVEDVIAPVAEHLLLDEIEFIKKEYLLFNSGTYSVLCAPSRKIPNLMTEIGRLREITFRAVGEGTNRSIDIDEFDLYYQQLIIWDNEAKKLVGGYRVGKGRDIINRYDIKGFYTQSLFRIHPRAKSILEQSLELGRSFIVTEYQRKPLSLFMLWKGILYYLIKNPEYRYLIGPVSISNDYSPISKSLIIKFIMENFFHAELAQLFKPRNAFRPKAKVDLDILLENTRGDLNRLDTVISEIESKGYKLPVLLKKYLKLNARIITFNIDPKFNDALDGLIILDLMEVPYNTIKTLSKEINDDTILHRFNNPSVN